MKRTRSDRSFRIAVGAAASLMAGASLANAAARGPAETDRWALTGTISLSEEYYDIQGDRASSPYQFDGSQPYAQIDMSFEQSYGEFRTIGGQFLGIVSDSKYRSRDDGFVPERIRLWLEDGNASIPYRAEFGDSYAYFSQRTLQRPLKGIRGELQSTLGRPDRMHSLQFVSGVYNTNWRNLRLHDDLTTGLSWLIQDPRVGSLAANFVNTEISPEFGDGFEQRIFSAAGYAPIRVGGNTIAVEGEFAHQRQSVDGVLDVITGNGYFGQLSESGASPLSWRLRYELYDDTFAPVGAPLVSDRRLAEANLGWRLGGGTLRARYHDYRDGNDSANPLDSRTIGLRYGGQLIGGVTAAFDAFVQQRDDRANSLDSRASTLDVDLRKSFGRTWRPRLTVFFRDDDDRLAADLDARTLDTELAIGRRIQLGALTGTIEPGIAVRRITGDLGETDDIHPSLSLSLASGNHSLVQSLRFQNQDRGSDGEIDVGTFSYSGAYRYNRGDHYLRLEFDSLTRNPDPGLDTESYRLAGTYGYRFDLRPGRQPVGGKPQGDWMAAAAGDLDLSKLVIGSEIAEVVESFRRHGWGEPSQLDNVYTYFRPMFDGLDQSQRIVLIAGNGRLQRASVVIAPRDAADRVRFEEELGRLVRFFVSRYGRPTSTFEEGKIGTDVRASVNQSGVIRMTQWEPGGGLLRFGIPRRQDTQVTFELMLANELPAVTDTFWSIDDSRR